MAEISHHSTAIYGDVFLCRQLGYGIRIITQLNGLILILNQTVFTAPLNRNN